MTDEQNWRTDTNAEEYFGQQKKKVNLADRRPVIRKASDLVGPGIGPVAIPITDYNDLLATYNGYFSAPAGTFGAPNDEEDFVGFVINDATMGGVQTFIGLDSHVSYQRVFRRNPSDPESILWDSWTDGGPEIGLMSAYAGATAPDGWLICNGASLSTTTYAALFAVIGYTYGGSGANFNLPDTRDRALYGVGTSWALGGNDGVAAGSRTKSLDHGHSLALASAGAHSHIILTEGGHTHGGNTGGPSSAVTPQSGSGANVASDSHNHSILGDGAHDHFGATGGEVAHSHTGSANTSTGVNPRGVGVNWIIRAE